MDVQVKEDRSIWIYMLLNLVTCGIYSFFFFYDWIKDVNEICDGDGEETPGLLKYLLLSLVTCGIYAFIWQYNLQNRLNSNGSRYGVTIQETGSTVLLWQLLGSWLMGAGWLMAFHIMFQSTNKLARMYNQNGSASGSRPDIYEPYTPPQLPPEVPNYNYSSDNRSSDEINRYDNPFKNQESEIHQTPPVTPPPVTPPVTPQVTPSPVMPPVTPQVTPPPVMPSSTPQVTQQMKPVQQPATTQQTAMGKVQCTKGVALGQGFRLPAHSKVVIGKNPAKATLVINDSRVSNVHCSIQYNVQNNTYVVTDHSTNGTFVNGVRLQKDVPMSYPAGTILVLVDGSNEIKLG